ncbi:MAG: class I SAM-dependent methyltransferase [Dehalococcoidia bacterium]
MAQDRTKEPQYMRNVELREAKGLTPLGLGASQTWYDDPRRLTFLLARYKFVSKMLSGRRRVLEVGCGDAFGSRIVLQEVEQLTAVDFDRLFVEDAIERMEERWRFTALVHDMLDGPVPGEFDAAYSLDVIEHIPAEQEDTFVGNIVSSLTPEGVLIVGTPSLESQQFASPPSKAGHVNCKTGPELKALMERFFHNVFLFSMNDEVIHTGFAPMAHYRLALCCTRKGPA